jgi:hypothetical protein
MTNLKIEKAPQARKSLSENEKVFCLVFGLFIKKSLAGCWRQRLSLLRQLPLLLSCVQLKISKHLANKYSLKSIGEEKTKGKVISCLMCTKAYAPSLLQ